MKTSQRLTLPNYITFFRIISIIPILALLQFGHSKIAILLLSLALLSDYFDGRIARLCNCQSSLGALLDPIADKLVVIFFMGFFVYHHTLKAEYFIIATLRDLAQLFSIPILLFWKKIPFKVKPKLFAKIATTLKFLIIGLLSLRLLVTSETMLHLLTYTIGTACSVSFFMEFVILFTFLKRFFEIYQRRHDTFE